MVMLHAPIHDQGRARLSSMQSSNLVSAVDCECHGEVSSINIIKALSYSVN